MTNHLINIDGTYTKALLLIDNSLDSAKNLIKFVHDSENLQFDDDEASTEASTVAFLLANANLLNFEPDPENEDSIVLLARKIVELVHRHYCEWNTKESSPEFDITVEEIDSDSIIFGHSIYVADTVGPITVASQLPENKIPSLPGYLKNGSDAFADTYNRMAVTRAHLAEVLETYALKLNTYEITSVSNPRGLQLDIQLEPTDLRYKKG